ncbi:MAG: GDP-mannose 4,6-dehydratase [Sphingomonas sp.]
MTGGSGFTGSYLVPELELRGCEVICFEGEIADPAAIRSAVAQARPDRVIHLAAITFIGSDDFEAFYRVNQIGTFHLLDAVAKAAPTAHVLIASSANIYGNGTAGYLDEATPPNPANHYAVSKWAMECGARLWGDRLHITVTRPFNYTGAGQSDSF